MPNRRPRAARLATVAVLILTSAGSARQPAGDRVGPREPAPHGFSPNAFMVRRAVEQAFPLEPGDPRFEQAAARTFWLFQGQAYRGTDRLGAAWTSLGPLTSLQDPTSGSSSENVSGRVSALAVSPACELEGPCRLWVGTAGGGVWRTDDAMHPVDVGWRWISQGLGTNNIGSLGLDPNDTTGNTIYVGTGETNQPNNSGAGTGLYRSTDGGDRWARVPTLVVDPAISPSPIDFTFTRGIAAVVVEPGNPQVLYVATTSAMLGMTGVRGGQTQTTGFAQPRVGLYRTRDAGATWELVWVPPLEPVLPPNPHLGPGVGDTMFGVRDVQLDPRNPSIIYATAFNNAIHRSAPSLEGGDASFKPVYAIVGLERFRDLAMFDLTVAGGRTRMYVYNGTDRTDTQGLYRLDDADVPASSLVTVDGSGALVNTSAWIGLSSNDTARPGATSRRICGSQCFYDLVVAVPDERPDTVLVGGVADPNVGEPTIRSTNAGASFFGFGNDAQNPRNRSHVDVRAIVFHPQAPDIAFVGSDGGVVRNDGTFSDNSRLCTGSGISQCTTMLAEVPTRLYFLNRGLQTLQFYNVALDPRAPLTRLMGGLQDNSTVWRDGTGDPLVWKALFPFGDGTSASGFHPARPEVLFASFQSTNFFTNFRNGDPAFWVRTDRPISAAGERGSVTASTGRQFLAFDRVNPDTQFTAFQHVWRTQANGGPQAFLEASCRFPGPSAPACGDWVPLGVAYPFPAGSNPESPERRPGDLTSDFYGPDRAGGLVVAAERATADAGTLWAATNFGRLFVSKNADAPGADVEFVRIDTATTPGRFVTRIAADPASPDVAFVSYSGFDALTPATPGHVARVTYEPTTRIATFEWLDHDLGDIPVNTVAWDHLAGDLYAATDYGPLVLRQGSTSWTVAGVGFPLALMVDLEIVPEQRILVAATHGLGVFALALPALEPDSLRTSSTPRRSRGPAW